MKKATRKAHAYLRNIDMFDFSLNGANIAERRIGFKDGYEQAIKDVLRWAKIKQKRFRKFHGNGHFELGLDAAMEEVIYNLTEDMK